MSAPVRWDAGLEPPDICDDDRHEDGGCCPSCCRCRDCRDAGRLAFDEDI